MASSDRLAGLARAGYPMACLLHDRQLFVGPGGDLHAAGCAHNTAPVLFTGTGQMPTFAHRLGPSACLAGDQHVALTESAAFLWGDVDGWLTSITRDLTSVLTVADPKAALDHDGDRGILAQEVLDEAAANLGSVCRQLRRARDTMLKRHEDLLCNEHAADVRTMSAGIDVRVNGARDLLRRTWTTLLGLTGPADRAVLVRDAAMLLDGTFPADTAAAKAALALATAFDEVRPAGTRTWSLVRVPSCAHLPWWREAVRNMIVADLGPADDIDDATWAAFTALYDPTVPSTVSPTELWDTARTITV